MNLKRSRGRLPNDIWHTWNALVITSIASAFGFGPSACSYLWQILGGMYFHGSVDMKLV